MLITKIPPRLLLPLMMFVGVLAVGLRVGDAWNTITTGAIFTPIQTVQAEEKNPPKKKSAEPKDTKTTRSDAPSAKAKKRDLPETELYKQLVGRRDYLEKRAKGLDAREAMVSVAEKRIDQKLNEMKVLQKQLKSLLGQASASQTAQIANLVKIYETMKPKEAARIFEKLDMKVLLNVVQRMKPARTAAVLAKMDPLKAKTITVALTERDELPAP